MSDLGSLLSFLAARSSCTVIAGVEERQREAERRLRGLRYETAARPVHEDLLLFK